jgi:hypothetical protein
MAKTKVPTRSSVSRSAEVVRSVGSSIEHYDDVVR